MLASHRLMMRIAARSDHAMHLAVACGGRYALPFDGAAARLGGMMARLNDHYRRGLLTLRQLGGTGKEPEGWSYGWEGALPSFEDEAQRRIDQAEDGVAANDLAPEPAALDPADEAALDAAEEASRRLAADARVANLTDDEAQLSGERLLIDQMAAGHRLMMRLSRRADWELDRIGERDADPEPTRHVALRLAGTAARLMERYRQNLLALERLGTGPGGGPRKTAGIFWDPLCDDEREQGMAEGAPVAAAANDAAAPAAATASTAVGDTRKVGPALARRGRLRHGNPSGDFLAAPRCGACTRAGHPCRQPAMANGRCRLHGGKSTGPRTATGRARSAAARLTHGMRSAEIIDLRAAAAASARRLRALVSCPPLAGHGVHRRVFRSPLGGAPSPAGHTPAFDGRGTGSESARLRRRA